MCPGRTKSEVREVFLEEAEAVPQICKRIIVLTLHLNLYPNDPFIENVINPYITFSITIPKFLSRLDTTNCFLPQCISF